MMTPKHISMIRRPAAGPTLRRVGLALGMAAATGAASPALAQTINYVIPFPAGGESDVTARLQEPVLKQVSGHDVVVQYKVGAGGATAWASLAKLPSDGYTIMGTNLPHIFLQPMQKDVGYKSDDIVNVFVFELTPDAIVVPADSPYKTLKDLIAAAKKTPGAITMAGSGTNTGPHLSAITFNKLAGVKTTYIPFSGTATSVAAMLGKQVNAAMTFSTAAIQQGAAVRMLAVATDERLATHPDVPTFKELGIDMVSGVYRGVAVNKATPEADRKRMSDWIGKVNADPGFRKKMTEAGFVLTDVPYEKVPAFLDVKRKEYEEAAREVGMLK